MIAIRNLHEQTTYTLAIILKVLDFPKATYHYHLKRVNRPDKDKDLKNEILDIRKIHKDYGYRRVCAELWRRGHQIGKNKVQRLMKSLKLQVTSFTRKSRKYNSYKGDIGKTAPNRLKRRFTSTIPHQKIVTDTTEFRYYDADDSGQLQLRKLYLDPFIDLFNMEVVS